MMNSFRICEAVQAVLDERDYSMSEKKFLTEAEKKLGKAVDEKKWSEAKAKTKSQYGGGLQKTDPGKFYSISMTIYKSMMGEGEEEGKDEKSTKVEIPHKPGHYQFTFKTCKGKDAKTIRRIYKGEKMHDLHDKAKAQALKDYPESYDHVMHSPQTDESIQEDEGELAKAKAAFNEKKEAIRALWSAGKKEGENDYADLAALSKKVKDLEGKKVDEAHEGEDLKPHEKRLRYEEAKKTHINRPGAKVKIIKGKDTNHLVSADSNDEDHLASGDEKTLRNHAKEKGWKIVGESELTKAKATLLKNHIEHLKGLIQSAPQEDKVKLREILKGEVAALKRAEGGKLDEAEEGDPNASWTGAGVEDEPADKNPVEDGKAGEGEEEDPTRDQLETAKDEKDEKKGGPAELSADLRVSVRIEQMNLRRYERMIDKNELAEEDAAWLKEKIENIKKCIAAMEKKIPELEREAGANYDAANAKEAVKAGIRKAIMEIATGK